MRYAWGGELEPVEIKAISPQTEVMCRPWQTSEVQPDWSRSVLYTLGRALPAWCQPEAGVDFWQTINEPGYGPGTASYWNGALDEANARGIKLAVGCFPWGTPRLPNEDPAWWNTFYPILRRCRDEGHAFMLHQYMTPDPGAKGWIEPWGIMRHKQLYAQLPADLRNLPLRIGEFGTAYANKDFSAAEFAEGVAAAQAQTVGDTYLKWWALWSVGGAGAWSDSQIYADKIAAIKGVL